MSVHLLTVLYGHVYVYRLRKVPQMNCIIERLAFKRLIIKYCDMILASLCVRDAAKLFISI